MPFQILSLSGGGFLGLYTACVIAELEEHFKCRIADHFDLIAGTSVGGIIALGLANQTPASQIRDAFIENGPTIFSPDPPPSNGLTQKLALLKNALSAKYHACALRKTIEGIVGPGSKIGALKHCVMVPAVNLTKGSPQVFKTSHHPTFHRDRRLQIVDVALATSAAPTFFPTHRIGGELFADGGLYANSPDELALHEALHFFEKPLDEVRMLSIGTTTSKFSFSNAGRSDLGWVGWMNNQRLPRVMIAAQQINAEFVLKHRLQDNYLRIDQPQSPEQERSLSLDTASSAAIKDLTALAEASVRDRLGQPHLHRFFQHLAAPPIFYNQEGN